MSLQSVTDYMSNRVVENTPLPKVIKFHFGDEGVVRIDGTVTPPVVDNQDLTADFTVKTTLELFENILNKTQNPMTAFTLGKLKVEGDMALGAKLGQILGL